MEESTLIRCSDWGSTRKVRKKERDVKNVGERHPLLQLTGEHKKTQSFGNKKAYGGGRAKV